MGISKVAVVGLVSILLVVAVIIVALTGNGISTTSKAVENMCSPTDYKETCEKSLADTKTSDPNELIKAGFTAAVNNLQTAIKSSALYRETAADERSKKALDVCEEVLAVSVDDLLQSFDEIDRIQMSNLDTHIHDVKTWLSAAIDHHESCIDAFENTTDDTGEKMKKLLEISSQMLSNSLAMASDFSSIISELEIPSLTNRRRLLEDPIPDFVDGTARKLMEETGTPATVNYNIVVAQDGSGQFKTITEAINSLPKKNNETIVIHIKAGIYKENIIIPKKVNNIKLIGDGPLKTKISGDKNFIDGTPTFHTSVLSVNAADFMAKDLTIENTAGPEKHQAVAVRVSGDKAIFYNVVMDGYQDTLYAHSYRQYYRNCVISGTIDFIFGDAQAVFQKCKLLVRKPMENQGCMVTAQGRKEKRSLGVTVIQACEFVCEAELRKVEPAVKVYLGRPWKEFSRTIIMESYIDGFVAAEGWSPWMGDFALDTLYYAEYKNSGPGSNTGERVTWKGIKSITPQIAESFTAAKVFGGDEWVTSTQVPYTSGMMQ